MENKTKIIIGLCLIIFLLGFIIFYLTIVQGYLNSIYTKGYNDGIINLITEINKNGQIPIIQGNSTQMVDIKTICQQLK